MTLDISTLSFERWVDFIFDHTIEDPPWHFSSEWQYEVRDPRKVVSYLTRLFTGRDVDLDKFSNSQLDQGFWFLPGSNGLLWVILNPTTPWQERQDCIRSIYTLFDGLLANVELESATYMWWDSVITYCAWDNTDVILDKRVLEEIVTVIARLRNHSNLSVRESANHGIEHLAAIADKEPDTNIHEIMKKHGIDTT